MAVKKPRYYETRVIKNEGAKMHLMRTDLDGNVYKLHNWDGPAIKPFKKDSTHETQYFLYGMEYTKDDWQEAVSQREGLPWYKNQSMKSQLSAYRH